MNIQDLTTKINTLETMICTLQNNYKNLNINVSNINHSLETNIHSNKLDKTNLNETSLIASNHVDSINSINDNVSNHEISINNINNNLNSLNTKVNKLQISNNNLNNKSKNISLKLVSLSSQINNISRLILENSDIKTKQNVLENTIKDNSTKLIMAKHMENEILAHINTLNSEVKELYSKVCKNTITGILNSARATANTGSLDNSGNDDISEDPDTVDDDLYKDNLYNELGRNNTNLFEDNNDLGDGGNNGGNNGGNSSGSSKLSWISGKLEGGWNHLSKDTPQWKNISLNVEAVGFFNQLGGQNGETLIGSTPDSNAKDLFLTLGGDSVTDAQKPTTSIVMNKISELETGSKKVRGIIYDFEGWLSDPSKGADYMSEIRGKDPNMLHIACPQCNSGMAAGNVLSKGPRLVPDVKVWSQSEGGVENNENTFKKESYDMIAPMMYDSQYSAYTDKNQVENKNYRIGYDQSPEPYNIRWNKYMIMEVIRYCHDDLKYDYSQIFLTFDCKAFYIATNYNIIDSPGGTGSEEDITKNIKDLTTFFQNCTHDGTPGGKKLAGIIGWGADGGIASDAAASTPLSINKSVSDLLYSK
jgi:hypothetical protein